jgi:flagellar hook-associated protein 2
MAMTFDGIASGLPTDQMIKAIMSQESAPLTRLQNKQEKNTLRKVALSSIKSSLMSIATSITSLKSTALNKRAVTSSDSNVATAIASGAANGTYDLKVTQLATKARLETTNYMSSSNDIVGMAGDVFTLVGKDGKETKIELKGNTTLAGLNSLINDQSKDTKITSSVIQLQPGKYSLVLTSAETGTADGNGEIGIFAEYNSKLKTSGSVEKLTDSVGKAGDVFTLVDKDGNKTDITLEDGKTSLADLNNAINAKSKDTGISSSVVKLASGEYSLVLATKDGVNAGDIGIFGN